jgi:hypothetical protein
MPRRSFVILSLVTLAVSLSSAPAAAGDGQHLFILTGQSNMREPLPSSFKQAVSEVFGKDNVVVVTVGWPSQPIKMWHKGWTPPEGMEDPNPDKNGTLYDDVMRAVRKAIAGTQVASVTLVWMQGEEDARAGWGSVYERSFRGVLDQLATDLGVTRINFVLGRINDYWLPCHGLKDGDVVRSAQVALAEAGPHGAWIDTDDLNTGVNPWGGYSEVDGHFPPAGYRVMGRRFARKACQLIDPTLEPDERVFAEDFFDSAADVKSHAAIGATLAATPHDALPAGGGDTLMDGRFGAADSTDAAWVGFPPRETPFELVVDLGVTTEIDAIGIDLLVSPGTASFPKRIVYSVSEDGRTYRLTSSRHNSIAYSRGRDVKPPEPKPRALLVVADQGRAAARYVKIEITTGAEPALVDEVIVNPRR